jgi:hypothetical protein
MGFVRTACAAAVVGVGLFRATSASAAVIINGLPLDDITRPGDPIVGVSNTGVGGPNNLATEGFGDLQYPGGEAPRFAIDDDTTGSKYLNFGETSVGFVVTPSGGATPVVGLRFSTGNDEPQRDPLTYTLEGSNDPNAGAAGNMNWTLISYGLTGLTVDPDREMFQADATLPLFLTNATPYTSYRLIFTSVRDGASANSMQIGEVELLTVVPEPASMSVLALGALGLLARRGSAR